MTENNDTPDTNLPAFSVNVAPTRQITTTHLETLLDQFRKGRTEPLVFGDHNKPEAAIIPFADFVRLMRNDHAKNVRDEDAFQSEVSQRIQASDARRAAGDSPGKSLEDLAETLGEPAASMLRKGLENG